MGVGKVKQAALHKIEYEKSRTLQWDILVDQRCDAE